MCDLFFDHNIVLTDVECEFIITCHGIDALNIKTVDPDSSRGIVPGFFFAPSQLNFVEI